MKRQLDKLKGKRLVTGDPNLMTKDEICINVTPNGVEVKEIGTDGKIKDLAGSGEGGDSGSSDVEYWKITNINSDVEHTIEDLISYSTLTVFEDGGIGPIFLVTKGLRVNTNPLKLAFMPIYLNEYINSLKKLFIREGINPDDYLIPITKEEFYDLNNSDDSEESTVKEGDLIYYTLNDSFTSIRNITDNITQIAVGRGESMSSGNVGNLNRFVDIQDVTINKEESYVSVSIPNFTVVDMPAFVYKVGSDLKTAEDIIGNSSITRITKEEYDNIFNM